MHLLKSALREESKAADTFETYKNPNSGKLDEDGLFEIMVANNFLVTTTTDAEVLPLYPREVAVSCSAEHTGSSRRRQIFIERRIPSMDQ